MSWMQETWRRIRNFQGRLKRGVTLQQAEAQLNVVAVRAVARTLA
jgi:hypothetical protein